MIVANTTPTFKPVTIQVTFENETEFQSFRLLMASQTTITDVLGGTAAEKAIRINMMRELLKATYL